MTVFADTFALIAWLNPRDHAHQRVVAFLDGYTGRLLTTEWVLMEVADALSAPDVRATTVEFLRAIREDLLFEIVGYELKFYQAGLSCSLSGPIRLGHSPIASRLKSCRSAVSVTL